MKVRTIRSALSNPITANEGTREQLRKIRKASRKAVQAGKHKHQSTSKSSKATLKHGNHHVSPRPTRGYEKMKKLEVYYG